MYMQKLMQKVIAMALSAVMLFGLLPVSALAAGGEEDTAQTALVSVGTGSGGGSIWMWTGEKLAGGVVSSISGYGMNQAMGAIFGAQNGQVLRALDEIKAEIGQVKTDINNLSKKIDKVQLQTVLNEYGDFIIDYNVIYNALCEKTNGQDPEIAKRFLTDLYSGKNENYKVGGKTLIHATLVLGERLRSVKTVEAGDCNIFGAFDLLDRYTNVWEHQGYEDRQRLRDTSLAIHTLLSAMSQLACQTVIENNQGTDDESRSAKDDAMDWQKQLENDALKVAEMNTRCAIVKHPNLRIARDIKAGTVLCAFLPNINIASVITEWNTEAWADFSQSVERYTSVDYLWSMTRCRHTAQRVAWSQGWEVLTNQPTPDEYRTLWENYGGQQSLYNIFFDPHKGNFNNVGNVGEGLSFLCNHYVSRREPGSTWVNWEAHHVVGNHGELATWWLFSKVNFGYDGYVRNSWFDYSNAFIVNKDMDFFDDYALQAPIPPSDIEYEASISGMEGFYELPYADTVTLEVYKSGDAYQWSINKNDGTGFVEIEDAMDKTYTLPTLEASMNGWQYSCAIIDDPAEPGGEPTYTLAAPVTLNLIGEGIPEPVTEHDVGDAESLTAALKKVQSGEWSGHTLRLTAEILYPLPVTLSNNSVTIDTNGYTLTIRPDAVNTEPNINPESDMPQIAAVCLRGNSALRLSDGLRKLNVVAGDGIAYGVYVGGTSYACVNNITSTGGGTAIYATDISNVTVDSISAAGDKSYGAECLSGSTVTVTGYTNVSGNSSCGVYLASWDGGKATGSFGDITVSGENSRGILLDAENASLTVKGNVTVTGGIEGISAGKGEAEIYGNVIAPDYTVNAWNDASVIVRGNVVSTDEDALAVSSSGADVHIQGGVTSTGEGGTGINASAWDLVDPAVGANVTVDGKISADTPLRIESLPVEESEHTEKTTKEGYYTFTDGTNIVWAKPGYAQWSKNSSGGRGPVETPKTETNVSGDTVTATTTVTAAADSSGNAAATVSRTQLSDAIDKAVEEAEKQGEGTVSKVEVKVEAPADAAATEISIPKEAVTQASEAGISALTISTPVASITFDANTLSTLSGEATGDVKITASKVEASSLSPEAQRTVGERPVFDFSVTSGGQTISQFGGNVSVSVPYTPKAGEDTDAIVIYYIKESGELEAVSNCIYDPATGMISFNTRHLSQYAVGYNKVNFKDVAESAWYSKAVGFIAAREITTGTGGGNFSPEVKLTRGQFMVMLMKAYGIAPDLNTKVNFADAGNTYYTGYLAAAKRLGISAGVGDNLFVPEKKITRQEMFTLLYKVLKVTGTLPQGNSGKTLSDFSDAGDIASWAMDAMTLLVETGTVGGSGGKLSPVSTTTRAEMAQVLYNLLSK
ncbi:MAG: S-layer homology domain-containing protein [Desulfotomaculaceae bacterium]|nr:S-layer homology domain-containing protein [Desulfotomaculaceae bacterium]